MHLGCGVSLVHGSNMSKLRRETVSLGKLWKLAEFHCREAEEHKIIFLQIVDLEVDVVSEGSPMRENRPAK